MTSELVKGCGRTLGHGETCCEGYLCSGCRTLADRDAQIERLTAQLAEEQRISNLRGDTINKMLDQMAEADQQLAEARQAERVAMSEVNACKDALAQTAEFICIKCGRRQDGPRDNEARF